MADISLSFQIVNKFHEYEVNLSCSECNVHACKRGQYKPSLMRFVHRLAFLYSAIRLSTVAIKKQHMVQSFSCHGLIGGDIFIILYWNDIICQLRVNHTIENRIKKNIVECHALKLLPLIFHLRRALFFPSLCRS